MTYWRLLDLTSNGAYTNMAIDEALLRALIYKETTFPTLRFYTWSPSAISIGCLQKIAGSLDFNLCSELGLETVRRPTGGRIVLHKGDFTYSLVFNEEDPAIPKGILPGYRKISQAIQTGLKSLGVISLLNPDRKTSRSLFCFSTLAKYEIVVDGKKIMGNAQKREKGVVLQQGSIMIENNQDLINQLFNSPKILEDFISLTQVLRKPIAASDLREAMIKGFEETFHISLKPGPLTKWEEVEAKRLEHEKYSKEQWTIKGKI